MSAGITHVNDFQGLARLRAGAGSGTPAAGQEAAREAARQFEALFVQMMLKSMRDANAVLGDSQEDTTYRDMFDQQIAMEMTRGKGLGIAEVLLRQIEPAAAGAAGNQAGATGLLGPGGSRGPLLDGLPRLSRAVPRPAAGSGPWQDFRPASRDEFLREVWPLARRAGAELGVDPRAIVAQAALESGWGSRLIRDGQGMSGNNLFGIKADSRWQGPRVTVTTLEYEGGLPKPQRAQFRAYPDLAAGFADYVRFLRENPRYTEALRSGTEPSVWAERMQDAGYATDPRYAEKLRGILDSPAIRNLPAALKAGGEVPT